MEMRRDELFLSGSGKYSLIRGLMVDIIGVCEGREKGKKLQNISLPKHLQKELSLGWLITI